MGNCNKTLEMSVDEYRGSGDGEYVYYGNLANAIILKATDDYKNGIISKKIFEELLAKTKDKKLKVRLNTSIGTSNAMIYDCEKFFRSDWFNNLTTSIDGNSLILSIRKQAEIVLNNRDDPEYKMIIEYSTNRISRNI